MEYNSTQTAAINFRLRPDIEWTEIAGTKHSWWIATDPLRTLHFRCSSEERKLLVLLSQSKSIDQWRANYLAKNPGQQIQISDLQRILRQFVDSGLLVSFPIPEHSNLQDGSRLKTTLPLVKQNRISEILYRVEQLPWRLIQSRWSLGNPQRFLKYICKYTDCFYSSKAILFWLALFSLVAIAILLRGLSDIDPIAWHPSRWTFEVPWSQIGNCAAILIATRIFHELGHAIVATRYGAKVQNVGLFWTLGIACPYVDVSDAWRLRSKSERIFVSLAGVYTEMIIATIAGIIWLNTIPCNLHTICWQTVIICSAMTFAVNINPLVRYDGYFALSDYLEVPNLRESCNTAFRRCFFKTAGANSISLSDLGLCLFGAASSLYRATITFTFAFAVVAMGRAWEMKTLSFVLATSLIVSSFVVPILRYTIGAFQSESFVTFRAAFGITLLVATIGYAMTIPLPSFVACEGSIGWADQDIVYTKESGHLISTQPFSLDNAWLRFRNNSAIEQFVQLDSTVRQARLAMFSDPLAGYPVEGLRLQANIALENQQQLESQLSNLKSSSISANRHSNFADGSKDDYWHPLELPPPEQIDSALESGFGQPSRGDFGYSIHDELNLGRWLPSGTPIGVSIRGEKVQVAATVPEEVLSQIQQGSRARIILAPYPSRIFSGRVASISDISSLEVSQANSKAKKTNIENNSETHDKDRDAAHSYGVIIEIDSFTTDGSTSPANSKKEDIDKRLFGAAASVVIETKAKTFIDQVSELASSVIRK